MRFCLTWRACKGCGCSWQGLLQEHKQGARCKHPTVKRGERVYLHESVKLTNLEASRTPVNELDGALRLDGRDSRLRVLGDDIAAIEQAARH